MTTTHQKVLDLNWLTKGIITIKEKNKAKNKANKDKGKDKEFGLQKHSTPKFKAMTRRLSFRSVKKAVPSYNRKVCKHSY